MIKFKNREDCDYHIGGDKIQESVCEDFIYKYLVIDILHLFKTALRNNESRNLQTIPYFYFIIWCNIMTPLKNSKISS